MEKKELNTSENKCNLILENRKRISVTGVLEVISFDEEKILLNTRLGMLTIKGMGLKMNKLDVQNGDVVISGDISAMIYSSKGSKSSKEDKESIFKKLFK